MIRLKGAGVDNLQILQRVLDPALKRIRLTLLVEGHYDGGGTIATHDFSLMHEIFDARLHRYRIDDRLAEAHAAMAVTKAHEWDWAAAERECKKAFELNPGLTRAHWAYSNQLRHRGRAA